MDLLPTLSARHAVYVRDRLIDQEVDPKAIFALADFQLPDDPEKHEPIPVAVFARMLEVCAVELNDDYFGLHTVRQFHFESSGIMTLTLLCASTVYEALQVLCRYEKFVDSGNDIVMSMGPDTFSLTFSLLDPTDAVKDQLNEYLIALLVQLLRTSTGKPLVPRKVWLRHSNTRDETELAEFFGVRVNYDADFNRVEFDNQILQLRQITAHHLLHGILSKALQSLFQHSGESQDMLSVVCREILGHASVDGLNVNSIAARLSMSPRSLRRRLAQEGHTFQDAKQHIRETRAKYFLTSTTLSLAEISVELGYSENSAFSRAFKSWTGESPAEYRRRR